MTLHSAFPRKLLQEIPEDEVYDLLSDQQRRDTLRALQHEGDPRRLASLALDVAGTSEPTQAAERARVRLYHTHLPKLERFELVRYDDAADLVWLTERGERLATAIDR